MVISATSVSPVRRQPIQPPQPVEPSPAKGEAPPLPDKAPQDWSTPDREEELRGESHGSSLPHSQTDLHFQAQHRRLETETRIDALQKAEKPRATQAADLDRKPADAKELATKLQTVDQAFRDGSRFNGVVVVAQGENVVFEGRYGNLDPGSSTDKQGAPSLETQFDLASVSKQFAARGLHELAKDPNTGLKLSSPVAEHFDLGDKHNGATLADLANHTAGIDDAKLSDGDPRDGSSKESLSGQLRLTMGERGDYQYSNLGYRAVASVIDRVAGATYGLSYEDYMKERVFKPLGMTDTGFTGRDGQAAVGFGTNDDDVLARRTLDRPETLKGETGDLERRDRNRLERPRSRHVRRKPPLSTRR